MFNKAGSRKGMRKRAGAWARRDACMCWVAQQVSAPCVLQHVPPDWASSRTVHCAADEEDEDEEGGGSAVIQKKKSIGPTGPLVASTVNKDKKKDDMQFSFESARSAVLYKPCDRVRMRRVVCA